MIMILGDHLSLSVANLTKVGLKNGLLHVFCSPYGFNTQSMSSLRNEMVCPESNLSHSSLIPACLCNNLFVLASLPSQLFPLSMLPSGSLPQANLWSCQVRAAHALTTKVTSDHFLQRILHSWAIWACKRVLQEQLYIPQRSGKGPFPKGTPLKLFWVIGS